MKKATKKTAAKKSPSKQAGLVGKTSGVGVQATWVKAFVDNTKAAKKDRRTDEQITAYMNREFPGRKSKVFSLVAGVRSKYNAGGFNGGQAPALRSVRFGSGGEELTPRGKAVATEQVVNSKPVMQKTAKKTSVQIAG